MALTGKKVAILAENDYQVLELWYPLLRMKEAGAEVDVVGPGHADTHTSSRGYPVNVDVKAADAKADDYDAVIVPGGFAPDRMRINPDLVRLVREANEQNKVVAAICHAGWVLASADVVRGKTVTCTPNIKDDMVNAGAEYVDEEVVVDGNLITSRNPFDLPAFCREIIKAMS